MSADTVAFWDLDVGTERQAAPVSDSVQPLIHTSGTVDIGIFDEQKDIRTPVNEADAKPGGKYYSIVKLFIRFDASETWTTATAWLYKADVLVTAAHCVFSHGQQATCVKAYIGYTAGPAGHRFVKRTAVPVQWMDRQTEQHDMAFLQLDSPFQNVVPISCDTPEISARQHLTVVGYPADVCARGVPGGEMYEMKIDRDINLEHTRCNMLRYQGDIQGGDDFTAVGVHIRGGSFNSAAVIGGPYGIKAQAFQVVLEMLEEGGGVNSGFQVEVDHARGWLNQSRLKPSFGEALCSLAWQNPELVAFTHTSLAVTQKPKEPASYPHLLPYFSKVMVVMPSGVQKSIIDRSVEVKSLVHPVVTKTVCNKCRIDMQSYPAANQTGS
ncbi:peptidase S1 domain protein [Metarhizium robertsii]|uniref:Peptidase S1 domain protein n=1 Tax=Metarhizium robertsii TaxID=568076 RepID=A0A0A1V400_9HYPO|nr:peptidase S1 domain protein [Metarhizium robertsii]